MPPGELTRITGATWPESTTAAVAIVRVEEPGDPPMK
jgi:hypothetical protein